MDHTNVKLFSMLQTRMAYLSERQSVLARNLSNANTPGYKPMDLKPLDFQRMAQQAGKKGLKTTHPMHFSSSDNGRFEATRQRNTFETTPTGNEVVLDEQMMKVSENAVNYQTTTSVYKKMLEMMRLAAGNRGGN